MLNIASKYLQFCCGPYGLLLDLSVIIEIADYDSRWCADSGSAVQHHGKPVLWRDSELLFIDLRRLLSANDAGLAGIAEPGRALVLSDTDSSKPLLIMAVDDVVQILDTQESGWHWFSGVDPQLDVFFDRLYKQPDAEQLLIRLAPARQWLAMVSPDTLPMTDTDNNETADAD